MLGHFASAADCIPSDCWGQSNVSAYYGSSASQFLSGECCCQILICIAGTLVSDEYSCV